MNSRIKLGPLAIFFAIIAIILSMLALLNYVTGSADVKLAERYAEVTTVKYALETRGSEFISSLDETLSQGQAVEADGEAVTLRDDGIYRHIEEADGYSLTIDFTETDGHIHVIRWRINKDWEEQNIYEDILH